MPETAIGLCPDVGGLYLLSRAPGELGTHAALTGARFGAGGRHRRRPCRSFRAAQPAGRADRTTPARVGAARTIGRRPAPDRELAADQGWIDECYAGDDVDVIVQRLAQRSEPGARAAAAVLSAMSPTALKVTLQATRRAAELTLDEVLEQDLRVGSRFLEHPDLAEGIRAMIIDKDRRPRWNPARLSEVSAADVAAFFEPLPPGTPDTGFRRHPVDPRSASRCEFAQPAIRAIAGWPGDTWVVDGVIPACFISLRRSAA